MTYARFFSMIATSTVVMFVLTYFNTWVFDHVYFSQTRFWMALMMGSAMTVVMLGFMWRMYDGQRRKVGIVCAAFIAGAAALFLVRSQATVGDVAWMRAMIPHHSIAILTSERAAITDPRVMDLAQRIIEAQRSEIDEMQSLIDDLSN